MNLFELIADNCFPSLHFVHKGVLLLLVLAYLSITTWLWIRTRKRAIGIYSIILPLCVIALGEVFLMMMPIIRHYLEYSSYWSMPPHWWLAYSVIGYYGEYGQVALLSLAVIYIAGLWFIFKRRVEQVFQLAVIYTYIVAGFNLYALLYQMFSLSVEQSAPRYPNFWIWTSCQWILIFSLLAALIPIVLISIISRPKGKPISNPGCILGCITALFSTLILQLFFLCFWFGSAFQAMSEEHPLLCRRVKELERIIQSQNQRMDIQKKRSPDVEKKDQSVTLPKAYKEH